MFSPPIGRRLGWPKIGPKGHHKPIFCFKHLGTTLALCNNLDLLNSQRKSKQCIPMLGDSSGSATFNLPDPQNQDEIQNMSTQSPLCWEQFGENSIVAFSMIFCCVSTCPEEMHFWPFFAKEILSMTNRTISTIYHRQNDEATCFCLRVGNRTCSCVFYNRYQKKKYIYIYIYVALFRPSAHECQCYVEMMMMITIMNCGWVVDVLTEDTAGGLGGGWFRSCD